MLTRHIVDADERARLAEKLGVPSPPRALVLPLLVAAVRAVGMTCGLVRCAPRLFAWADFGMQRSDSGRQSE
jgi:hypothetical protein